MYFERLPNNSRQVLSEINASVNPTQMLCEKFESYTRREKEELRGILRELSDRNYVNIQWANNKPYRVIISNSGRSYEEQLLEYENELSRRNSTTINIGNNNRFNNSPLSVNSSGETSNARSFYEKHPWISGILISLVAGIILLFSFWEDIINFIEALC